MHFFFSRLIPKGRSTPPLFWTVISLNRHVPKHVLQNQAHFAWQEALECLKKQKERPPSSPSTKPGKQQLPSCWVDLMAGETLQAFPPELHTSVTKDLNKHLPEGTTSYPKPQPGRQEVDSNHCCLVTAAGTPSCLEQPAQVCSQGGARSLWAVAGRLAW